jgi:sulfite reductase (NADPH) flavoprotein alpha-component
MLSSRRDPKLDQLAYAVLGLGDSRRPAVLCDGAHLATERFAELGARRLSERVECDVDFDAKSAVWIQQSVTALNAQMGANDAAVAAISTEAVAAPAVTTATREAPV